MALLRTAVFVIQSAALATLAAGLASGQVVWSGHVVDQNESPVAQARVSARLAGGAALETTSGPGGQFRLALPGPGSYVVSVDRHGYFAIKDRTIEIGSPAADVTLVLNQQQEVFQSVTVGEMPTPVDPTETTREQRLTGTDVNDVPYPASHSLRNSMKLIPGVTQDVTGGLHFHGGAEYQTQYLLDGFDITDPVTGRYNTLLAVEGVQSMDLETAREPAQYGRGSAGSLNIQTENGSDQFHYTATNFIPGVDDRGGIRIGDWTPRAVISGPLLKGHAWFSDSFDGEYNSGYVAGLPNGQNLNTSWNAGNLFHTQVNLTSANILYADLLTDFDHQAHYGLGVLDPISTTQGLSDHEWMAAVKDSQTWFGGALLEVGLAWQSVYHRSVPEGTLPYLVTPNGRSGNYFVDSLQNGRRDQTFVHYFPRARHWLGHHQIEIGGDAERLDYAARFQRGTYETIALTGLPAFETQFQGSGIFDRPNAVLSGYISDRWQPLRNVTVDAGWRVDWDELVRQWAPSPRVAVAWTPFRESRTRLNAGYAVLHDATNLALFSRPLDQRAITTPFNAAGQPEAPLVTSFVPGYNLKLPRYVQWSAGADHDFGHGISGRAEWMMKRGGDGFAYSPINGGAPGGIDLQPAGLQYGFGGTYALTNQRHDAYDEAAFTVRQSFAEGYGWMASYTRSRAVSNAVLDISIDQPLQVLNNFGRMPWDAPNRFLGWGYVPVPHRKKWAVAVLVDYRTGFPFAVTDDAGIVVGPVDGHRYPDLFDLNIAVERRFVLHGYRLALRVGLNNATGHKNPTAVNSVIGAPQYLQFFGDEGRHFELRIRWFGRAGK
jgi:hypothetical protein